MLLCRRHHRAVHERRFGLIAGTDGRMTFVRPNRIELDAAPALPVPLTSLDATTRAPDDIPVWDGTPFDVVYAIDVLHPSVLGRVAGTG